MKIQIINLILLSLIFSGALSCEKYKTEKEETNTQTRSNVTKKEIPENPYVGLRNQAMNVSYEQLGLQLKNNDEIYGMIMDWNMDDVIVTVVAFKTGDASVYLSTGQVFIGGYAHDSVVNAAQRFIAKGSLYLDKATNTNSTVPAEKGKTGFYIFTKSKKYYIEDESEKIENGQSELTELFYAGNEVITEYRLIVGEE